VNISQPFIHRPVATTLLATALLMAGAAAFIELPIAPLPKVDFPTIQVQANLPGASPETMASAVATPLERRFGRIAGVTEITSQSALGQTQITLQFELTRDADAAARDVQAAINAAGGELPPNLPARPSYKKVNPADAPILLISCKSDSIPLSKVFETANTVLAQKIAQVRGVGQVNVAGGQQPAVRVQADPQALAARGLSLEDLRSTPAATNSNTPKGAFTNGQQMVTLGANDQLEVAAPYKQLIVSYQNGAATRLADVANVFDSVEDKRLAAWSDGTRTVLLVVRRQPGASILETIDRVKALMPALRAAVPAAISIQVVLDRAGTIRASVEDI
jgi:multidrug efflux pump